MSTSRTPFVRSSQMRPQLFESWERYLFGAVLPELQLLERRAPRAEDYMFDAAYSVVPKVKDFLGISLEHPALAKEFSSAPHRRERLCEVRRLLAHFAGQMERYAADPFIAALEKSGRDGSVGQLITHLSTQRASIADPLLQFECIYELSDEIAHSGIGPGSRVIVIGSGAISISGLAFASAGAEVVLVDRDQQALLDFEQICRVLPPVIRDRISTVAADGAEVPFARIEPSHILVAGLTEGKSGVLRSICAAFSQKVETPRVLLRLPQQTLCRAFYFDTDFPIAARFRSVGHVHIGAQGYTDTHILEPLKVEACTRSVRDVRLAL